MSSASKEFTDDLLLQGIRLFSDGEGKLNYRGAKGLLGGETLEKLKGFKQEILELLAQHGGEITTFPLSYNQKSRCFSSQLSGDSPAFNIMTVMKIKGNFDTEAFQCAADQLVARNDILRTTYKFVNGELRQEIGEPSSLNIVVSCIDQFDESALQHWIESKSDEQFDLESGPLVRFSLLTIGDEHSAAVDDSGAGECYLMFVIHHINTDEVSYISLILELLCLYLRESGLEVDDNRINHFLSERPKTYLDYIRWEADRLSGERGELLQSYWQKKLSGSLPVLNLPTDFPRPQAPTYNGSTYHSFLEPGLSKDILAYSNQQSITPYVFFLSVFRILLQRYSNQEDMIIGISISSRYLSDCKNVVGDFVNILPFRSVLDEESVFSEYMDGMKDNFFDVMEHQEYPFSLIVSQLEKSYDTSRSPVYQIVFNWQTISTQGNLIENIGGDALANEFDISIIDGASTGVKGTTHDIVLTVKNSENSFACSWTYNTDLYKRETIARLDTHFQTLLNSILSTPNRSITGCEHLEQQELIDLNNSSNNTQRTYPKDFLIHQLFEIQADKNPGRVALHDGDSEICYGDLNKQANQLARHLVAQGVGLDTIVAVSADRSIDLMVGLLAVVKSGGCYLAIDPGYPEDRIEYMLDDSDAELVLLSSDALEGFPLEDRTFFLLDGHAREKYLTQYDSANIESFESEVSDDNLAYIIYTSGTTGNPKGVELQHSGAVNLAFNQRDIFSITENDKVLQFASISFDAATWEWMMALTNGATLYLLPETSKLNTQSFEAFVQAHEISCATLPPAYLNHLDLHALTSLRVLVAAGEAFSTPLARRVLRALPNTEVFNAYGPTEATICATCYKLGGPLLDSSRSEVNTEGAVDDSEIDHPDVDIDAKIPIGSPLYNCSCYVLDEHLRFAPIGVIGELYVGGEGVARGYLNQPELNKTKFVNNPFTPDSKERLYKTGDLVKRLEDGSLEFIGRNDSQVKIRGFRIELEEIESELLHDSRIKEAAVVLSDSDSQNAHLLAFASLDSHEAPIANRILSLSNTNQFSRDKFFQLENGMEVFGLEKSNTEYIYEEIFKDNSYLKHGIEIGEGACVFDVGANIGMFSVYLCNTLENVEVHAFEPITPIFNVFKDNVLIYGNDRVKANAFGLSNVSAETEFNFYPYNPGISGVDKGHEDIVQIVQRHLDNDERGIVSEGVDELLEDRLRFEKQKVSLSTLSSYIRDHDIQTIDLLKIDVERSEWEVLDGIDDEHWQIIKQIVVEVYDKEGELKRILSVLEQNGYEVYTEECESLKGTGLFHVFAKRTTDKQSNVVSIYSASILNTRFLGPKRIKEQIRERLRQHLPEYMIPSSILLMNSLPINQNGKIDRRVLPVDDVLELLECQYVAPVSETESALAQIWSQILGVERVGRTDHFFELGGHSLMATQLVSDILRKFQVQLPIQDVFTSPVLSEVANKIDEACASGRLEQDIIEPVPGDDVRPLSFSQERLWFFSRMHPDSRVYNISLFCRIRGKLNEQALLLSLQEIVKRHEILRSRFLQMGDSVVQIVDPDSSVLNVEHQAAGSLEQVDEIRRAEVDVHLDLGRGHLFKAKLITLGNEENFLVLIMHHSITDGWSLGILLKELASLYTAFANDDVSPLSPLAIQYGDYAYWERSRFSKGSEAGENDHLNYWRQRLADLPSLLNLPIDRPRPKIQSFKGSSCEVLLPKEFQDKLISFSKEQNVTFFMLLVAAYNVMLSRYCGQKDIAIGTSVANRRRKETEPLIGFFVNTLVLRSDLLDDPSFADFLKQVKNTALEAYSNQDVPFEKLVEMLQPERSLNYSPLVQATFVLQNMPLENLQFEGLTMEPLFEESTTSAYDLTFSFMESGAGLRGSIHYNSELFDDATIREMSDSFSYILEQVVDNPGEKISNYYLLPKVDIDNILEVSKGAQTEALGASLIHDLFANQVALHPDALAASDQNAKLSYRELDERSNQLANFLVSQEVSEEEVVAVCAERSVDLVIGILAVLKSGACYLAIDPSYPEDRIEYMLDDSGVRLLLLSSDILEDFPLEDRQFFLLDEHARAKYLAAYDSKNTMKDQSQASSDSLAYVIYTSGTTGKPKAVCLRHSGGVNLANNQKKLFGIDSEDRVLQFASISFDAATWEWMMALCNGASLHLLPESAKQNFEKFSSFVIDHKISCVTLPPAYLSYVDLSCLRGLRILVTAGEKLLPSLASEILDSVPGVELYNAYGPTESTVCATAYKVDPECLGTLSINGIPIGKPLENVTCYVLDENGFPVPNNVVGELFIGGVGVAKGYLNQPELNESRFINNLFAEQGHDRLYKTGDLVRRLRNGDLEFIGRNDSQLKIRGNRVELGEIESVLIQNPLIANATIVVVPGDADNIYLAAYVALKSAPNADGQQGNLSIESSQNSHDSANNGKEILSIHHKGSSQISSTISTVEKIVFDHLRANLPEYMIPNALVLMRSLPLTHNGKIDYSRLPPIDLDNLPSASYVPPSTNTEKALAKLWCEILNQPQIGISDNFFEKGGHSLLAASLIAVVAKTFFVEIDVKTVFIHPILKDLAREIENVGSAASESKYVNDISTAPADASIPLSYSQERLYFMWRMDPGSRAFNVPLACRMSGVLNVGLLEKSISEIVKRHEVLRTHYVEQDGSLIQYISPEVPFSLTTEELGANESWESWCDRALDITFDLNSDTLFSTRLLKVSETEHILLFVIHHSIADGWSLSVLVRELGALYSAFSNGEFSPLTPLDIQYGDFAYWQRHYLTKETIDDLNEYWLNKLSGVPALLNLPTDRPRGAGHSSRGAVLRTNYPLALSQRLNEIAREKGVTLFMLLLAAFNVLLSRYCGQTDIVVGTPVANRRHRDLESLIGFFVNTLVMRSDLSGDPRFVDLLAQTKTTALEAYSHQDMPFEKLVEALKLDRNINYPPLVQVSFVLQNMPLQNFAIDDLSISPLNVDNDDSIYDLTLSLLETEEGLDGFFQYNTELFDAATIQRFDKTFFKLLEEVAKNPNRQLSTIEILSPHERHLLLRKWNTYEREKESDLLVHELFEAAVRRNPDAIALVSQEGTIKYEGLNEQSNQLAHYLLDLGVTPNTIIAISSNRSINLIVGMLGVLKAGACYLAIDPNYPKDRIEYIFDDADIKYLLAEEILGSQLPDGMRKTILIDEQHRQKQLDGYSKDNPSVEELAISSTNSAYVIYTSGTTGKPKGVCLQHQGASNLAIGQAAEFSIQASDRVGQFASVGFDAATFEWMMALLNGASLYLIPEEVKSVPSRFEQYMADSKLSCLTLPPAYLKQLDCAALESLRVLICAGEKLDVELARNVKRKLPSLSLFNAYGPCEVTVCATVHKVGHKDIDAQVIPIGHPIRHTQCYVLDADKSLLPVGAIGELYVGGDGVSPGYLNNPEQTKEKFIASPYSSIEGARLYGTGDFVRRLPNGNLVYVGRYDSQVKLRGIRVELNEIEAVLTAHSDIKRVVVSTMENQHGEPIIVAYLVAGRRLDADFEKELLQQLRQLTKEALPLYMSPSAYSFVDEIPLTAHGKIDYKSLPRLDFSSEKSEFALPIGELEQKLANIWRDVLDIPRVGRDDNFFELGGHSLLAAKVLSRVQTQISGVVEMRELFKYQTISDLAGFIASSGQPGVSQEKHITLSDKMSGPVSFGQQRLLFVNEISEDTAAYHVPLRFVLNGDLKLPLFLNAVEYVVNRQAILRTSFEKVAELGFQQRIHDDLEYFARVIDLSSAGEQINLDKDGPVSELINQMLLDELSDRFELNNAPLFRLTIVKLDSDQHLIAFTFHHLVTDGWSAGLFVSELMASYEGFNKGNQNPLEPLPIRYLDYSLWQRDYLTNEALGKRITYWKHKLDNLHRRPPLPEDYVKPSEHKPLARSIRFTLGSSHTSNLMTICTSKNVTPYMLLLAAFKVVLHSLQGEKDIIVGSADANRGHVDTEKLVGFFVNTTVVRTKFDNAVRFDDVLQRIAAYCLESYPYQDLPFEKLVESIADARDVDKNPIFQIMFSMENIATPKLDYDGISLTGVEIEALHSRFDLEFHVQVCDGKVVGDFAYDPQLFNDKTIERILKGYESLLKKISQSGTAFKLKDINFATLTKEKPKSLKFELSV